jgi:hypothetical protein
MANLRIHFLLILLLFVRNVGVCQEFSYPKIKMQGTAISDFIPAGWAIIDSAADYYDFSRPYQSHAMVLQRIDTASIKLNRDGRIEKANTRPRILIILFKDHSSGIFKLIEQNNKFILPLDPEYAPDPLTSMKFDSGIFHISFTLYFGPSAHDELEYAFRYDGTRFVLIGANSNYFNEATREYRQSSFNFLSKKWWVNQGNGDSASTNKPIWHKITYKGLRPLSAFQEPYTWEFDRGQAL